MEIGRNPVNEKIILATVDIRNLLWWYIIFSYLHDVNLINEEGVEPMNERKEIVGKTCVLGID
jgi:hypothetical protein